MGRPNPEPSSDQTSSITHFSHPHPLNLTNVDSLPQNFSCSACKLNDTKGCIYTCKPCNFILHLKCYQLPHQIKHPFDRNHDLVLQPKPVYPEGIFNCDACGNHGAGFSYHCSPCGVDLHTTCATLPNQLAHKSHHHQLALCFAAPYPGNAFSCDVCKRAGSKTWMYRCNDCEFDVHLTCVRKLVPSPARFQNPQQAPRTVGIGPGSVVCPPQPYTFVCPPNAGGFGSPRPQPVVMGQPQSQFPASPYPYNNLNQPIYGAGPGPVNGGGLTDQLLVSAANGLASGVAQATTEAVIGFFGGGGGGGGGMGFVDVTVSSGVGGPIVDGGYNGEDYSC
ncbi:hypothetical protein OROMI_014275 [Orobanche minor]